MLLDADQSRAISARQNLVVSAGAGSGKTRVLTQRFVDLVVNDHVAVPEILALTFTRKAAAEMFARIHQSLLEHADNGAHVRNALLLFDEAQISTIDSFCAGILRDGAIALGVPSVFAVSEGSLDRGNEIMAERFLAQNATHPILSRFVRDYGIDGTKDKLLLPLLERHMRLSRPIDFADLSRRRAMWLAERSADLAGEIRVGIASAIAIKPNDDYLKKIRDTLIEADDDLDRIAAIGEEIDFRRGKRDELSAAFKSALRRVVHKKDGLVRELSAIRFARAAEPDATDLYKLFAEWQEEVLAQRRQSGTFGYQEIMELAVQALLAQADLLESYRRRFRYVMIDEFQDNNSAQRDLLFLLAGEGVNGRIPRADELRPDKLFFVGDQKQSIYRFRGADVSVFKRLAEEISATENLRHNYRSEPRLIQFYNKLFAGIFADAQADYEAVFEPLADRGTPRDDVACRITLAWVDGNPPDQDLAPNSMAEGDWIAREIRRLIDSGTYTGDQIAILMRSTTNQQHYERMLRRIGIPYQTQALRTLFLEAPAVDLTALFQLFFHPRDKTAYATVLRSPFVMASDEALWHAMRAGLSGPFENSQALSPSDRRRFAVGRRLLEEIERLVDREPLAVLVERLWELSGYRYAILSRASDHAYLEHFDYLTSIAQAYEDRPAIEFVEFMRGHLGRSEKLDEFSPPRRPGAVQLMTIHKSKGLEFPVVFVVDCDSRGGKDTELVMEHPGTGLVVNIPPATPADKIPNVFSTRSSDRERAEDLAERKRLLYVAATRAETMLYFTAAMRKGDKAETMWRMIASVTQLEPEATRVSSDFADLVHLERIAPLPAEHLRNRIADSTRVPRAKWEHLPDEVEVLDFAPIEIDTSPSLINEALLIARKQRFTLPGEGVDRDRALVLGTLSHLAIELRLRDRISKEYWQTAPFAVERVQRDISTDLLDEAWTLSESFLTSDFYRSIASCEFRYEIPFLFCLDASGGERVVHGQMDLVARAENHTFVVDFKSDHRLVPTHYDGQMAVYRAAAAALFGTPVTVHLFSLRDQAEIQMDSDIEPLIAEIERSADAIQHLGWVFPPEPSLL